MSELVGGITAAEAKRLLTAFLSTRRILIADPNGSARAGYAKTLITLGAKTNRIHMVGDFNEAYAYLLKDRPELVVSEYMMPGGSGLDLAQETRNYENQQEKIFCMVTANSSQSVVAMAAEEDVDVFLVKPYTVNTFTDTLSRAVLMKSYPSEYIKVIEQGKRLLATQKASEAIDQFQRAASLNQRPSLALYYKGQSEVFLKQIPNAETSFKTGLEYNGAHLKCLSGLFTLLMEQQKIVDAYAVVKNIANVFPANPKRLAQILTLAVQTGNFSDIDTYYDAFRAMEARSDELVKYVCAALVVAARHMFRFSDYERAVDLLKKAAVSAAGRPGMLRQITLLFIDHGYVPEAKSSLDRFPAATHHDPSYLVSKVLYKNAEEADPRKAVAVLREFMKGKVTDPLVHVALIKRLRLCGKELDAEEVFGEACRLWPAQKADFELALNGPCAMPTRPTPLPRTG